MLKRELCCRIPFFGYNIAAQKGHSTRRKYRRFMSGSHARERRSNGRRSPEERGAPTERLAKPLGLNARQRCQQALFVTSKNCDRVMEIVPCLGLNFMFKCRPHPHYLGVE
jgi:hypothetical protein